VYTLAVNEGDCADMFTCSHSEHRYHFCSLHFYCWRLSNFVEL